MNKSACIIRTAGTGEVTDKKSKFIAHIYPVRSEEEALVQINQIKKQYWDASHNCYAYVIGGSSPAERCSDDGEPAHTAGRPILDVLLGSNITNALMVVTRYFGGTLLGTGGLIRAYTKAAQEALQSTEIITKITGYKLKLLAEYTEVGKVQYLLSQNQIPIITSDYTEKVTITFVTPEDQLNNLINTITEETKGKVSVETPIKCSYILCDGVVEILSVS